MNNKKLSSRKDIMNLSEEEQIIFLRDELNLDKKVSRLNFEKSLSDYWEELIGVHPSRKLNPKEITQDIKLSAAYFLLSKILLGKIQIIKGDKILLRNDDFGWVCLDKVHIWDFRNLFLIIKDRCGLNQIKYKELISSIERNLKNNHTPSNNVIQLKNGYFDGGIYCNGIYKKEVPNFFIPHTYDFSLCNLEDAPEFVDFIKYLSSNNKEVYDFILNTLASAFIQNIDFRSQNSYILRLFNQLNEEASNIFIELCKKIFYSEDNTVYENSFFEMSNNCKFNRATEFNSMILIDCDREREYLSENVSNFVKKLTDYDRFNFDDFYERYSSSEFLGLVIMPSNHIFKTDIEDIRLINKFVEIRVDGNLEKSQEWYNELFNNDKLKVVRNFLIKRALEFKRDSIINVPNILKNIRTDFMKGKHVILNFIEEFGRDNFENSPTLTVKNRFKEWCNDNKQWNIGPKYFKEVISSELGLKENMLELEYVNTELMSSEESDVFILSSFDKEKVRCWVS